MVKKDLDFEELLKNYDYCFRKGDLVKGVVCSYDSQGVMVDIGAKTFAIVPLREAVSKDEKVEEKFVKGNEYEFLIIRDEDEDGKFLLSGKRVDTAYAWKEIEKAKAEDQVILGSIDGIVKGGLLINVSGIQGFVPSSQLKGKETDFKVGDKIELKILSMDASQNDLILSNRRVYEDNISDARKNVFAQIEAGQIVKGDVVRITDFGAFVDIGGIDGLLPLSQLSWKWIEHPNDILKIGDKIEVEVIDVDHDKQRISLSLKTLEPDPWVEAEKVIKDGDKVEGLITRLKHYGAFVEVFNGIEALLPNNEVVEIQNRTGKILQVGDKIETYILKFNPTDRRISLTANNPEDVKLSDTKQESTEE